MEPDCDWTEVGAPPGNVSFLPFVACLFLVFFFPEGNNEILSVDKDP